MSLSFNAILLLNFANELHQKYHIPKHNVPLWWHIAKLPMVLPYPITYGINKGATCSINTVARGAVGVKHKLAFAG